jgi:hypothetical protein
VGKERGGTENGSVASKSCCEVCFGGIGWGVGSEAGVDWKGKLGV